MHKTEWKMCSWETNKWASNKTMNTFLSVSVNNKRSSCPIKQGRLKHISIKKSERIAIEAKRSKKKLKLRWFRNELKFLKVILNELENRIYKTFLKKWNLIYLHKLNKLINWIFVTKDTIKICINFNTFLN
jgi:DNA-binding sugar fermentation-stimulating protein